MRAKHAHFLGTYKGRKVYRVPVEAHLNNSRMLRTDAVEEHEVVAYSAADAANYVRDLYATRAETEVYAFGPKGGKTYRYIGWDSAIGAAMWGRRDACPAEQLVLQSSE